MSSDREPNDEVTREQLVAYLDGELGDAESEAIEARLAGDDSLREQVQDMDRVWNVLDDLPRATVGDGFARTTIEMAVVEAEQDVASLTAAMPVVKRRRGYVVAAACAAAVLVGFGLVRIVGSAPDRMLLSKLPVIQQIDALQDFDSPEFLRELPSVAGSLLASVDGQQVTEDYEAWRTTSDGDRAARREWVEALSDNEKNELLGAAHRYLFEAPDERVDEAAAVYDQIAASPDRDQLMRTMVNYEAWLVTQTASDQSRLRQMSDDERLAELQKINRNFARREGKRLSRDDVLALRLTLASLAEDPEFLKLKNLMKSRVASNREAELARADSEAKRREAETRARFITAYIDRSSPGRLLGTVGRFLGRSRMAMQTAEERERAQSYWSAVEANLVLGLSDSARQRFEEADLVERFELLDRWVQQAESAAVTQADLEEYFASDALTDDERHELLALPQEQMQKRLKALYLSGVSVDFGWEGSRGRSPRGSRGGFSRPAGGPDAGGEGPGGRRRPQPGSGPGFSGQRRPPGMNGRSMGGPMNGPMGGRGPGRGAPGEGDSSAR